MSDFSRHVNEVEVLIVGGKLLMNALKFGGDLQCSCGCCSGCFHE